ncbi:autotransporter outer membrane beta-barrel domain-containing protein, partial [Synergistaceae bacterium OttesenSCG-928-D05]|nr:autotransporter outer membrane beta-barrel domain-containing protein [Synergistaceae bacterium OttesenSCG-928-D05]
MISKGPHITVFAHGEKYITQKKKTAGQRFAMPLVLAVLLMFAAPAYPETIPGPYVSTDQTTTVKATGGDHIEVDDITVTTNANATHGLYADGGSISGTADVIINKQSSHAVYADNNATITLTGDIQAKGGTSNVTATHGVYANHGSAVVFDGNITVTAGSFSYGAFADNGSELTLSGSVTANDTAVQLRGGSTAHITSGAKIKTTGTSNVRHGINASGAGTEAYIGNNVLLDIKTQGLVATGDAKIYASDDIVIKGGSGGITATTGGEVHVRDGLSIDSTHVSVSVANNGKVYIGDNAKIRSERTAGLSESNGAGNEIHVGNGLHITAEGEGAGGGTGISSRSGKIYISDDATVVVKNGFGIYLTGANSDVRIGDRFTLNTAAEGQDVAAVYVSGGKLFIGDSSTMNFDGIFGIYSTGAGREVHIGKELSLDANSYAVYALRGAIVSLDSGARVQAGTNAFVAGLDGSKIYIGENADVTVEAFALQALQNGYIQAQDGLSVTVTEAKGLGIVSGLGGEIQLGNTKIHMADENGLAFFAQNNDEAFGTAKITGTGLYDIVGSLYAEGDAEIDLAMQSGSQLKGASYLSGDALEGHRGTIALKMDNAKWELTDDSELTGLTLGDGSQVDFSSLPLGSVLTVGTLTAGEAEQDAPGGVFHMKTDIVNEESDLLKVIGESSGNFGILVKNDGSAATTSEETLKLAETVDGKAEFKLANEHERISLGAYQYQLARADG